MKPAKKELNPNPIQNANIFSKLLLWWMKPVLWTGHSRDLQQADLFDVLDSDRSSHLGDLLERQWTKELNTSKMKGKDPSLLKAIVRTFGPQYMFSGLLSLIFSVVTKVARPVLLGKVIEFFAAGGSMSQQDALLCGGGMVLLGFASQLLEQHALMSAGFVGMRVRIACCSLMFRKVMKLSKTSSRQTTTGHLVNLMSNDVNRFDMAMPFLHFIWIAPLQVIVVTYFLWRSLGVSAFVGIAFIFLQTVPVQSVISKLIADLREKTAVKTDERIRLMNEIITGVQVIKMYAWEKPFAGLVSVARRIEMRLVGKASYLRAVNLAFMVFTERTALFCTIWVYYLFGNIITSDQMFSMGQFFNVLNLTLAIFYPMALSSGAEAKVSVDRVQEFLLQEERSEGLPVIHNISTNKDKKRPIGVTITNAQAKWEVTKDSDTLHNIFLNVKPGKLCAIIGPVGSGKSSLLLSILGELPLLRGSVAADDSLSYASQQPWLFVGSVRQNILFGEAFDKRRYEQVVRACALLRDLELLPHGDKTIVGERGVSLSGGQRARINLARAVYRSADLYLLDDPLSAVDTHVGKHLFDQCIRTYLRGKTVVLVTHQLQYLKDADMIVILKDGKVETQGTYYEMLNSGLDFAKLLPAENENTGVGEDDNDAPYVILPSKAYFRRQASLSVKSTTSSYLADGLIDPEVEEESQTIGSIKWDTYLSYARAGGNTCFLLLVTFVVLATQVVISGVDFWASVWTTMEEERQTFQYETDTNETGLVVDFVSSYFSISTVESLQIYGVLTATCLVIVLMRLMLLFHLCVRSSVRLHDTMFENVLRAKMRFFDTNPSGRILNRFSKDIGALDELLPTALSDVIEIFLLMMGILIMILVVNYIMIVPMIVTVSLFVGMRAIYISTARSVKRLEGITRSPVFSHLSSSINGLSTIRASQAQGATCSEFDEYQDRHTSAWYLFVACNTAFGLWLDNASNLFIAAITFTFLLSPAGTFGAAVGLALSQALMLTGMVQYGVRQSTQLVSQFTSVERVLEYTRLEQEPALESPPDKKPPTSWPEEGCISFLRLSLRYSESDRPVLKDLDFTILPTQKVGIVGRTGAGKSSLISALYRLADLEGTITIDDVDIQSIGLHDLRRRISIIPQEPVLFSASLRDNLDPFQEFGDHQLYSALEEVELKDSVGSLDFQISEGGANFSVGQRQLVCLARAILRNNKILVLDEATANVDPQTDALIQRTIRHRFRDCTVLTIAHRLNTIMDSDAVLVMDAGMIMEYGHPYTLLQNKCGYFYKMVAETGSATALQLHQTAAQAYRSAQCEVSEPEVEEVTRL
ncbi:ATP-binding cassette sub-family C member 4-like [Bacillus rossius redtenbacheri]|uniref:ATP-binding cassette sub-family C member 4-like n=1 Tax=Bacillus rossius redtenbacheri TaxID=93214 RepID=UPI002FDE9395